MMLFLNFDGVMHPEQIAATDFCRAPILWEILRESEHVNVVISSSWREIYPPFEVQPFFAINDCTF